MKKSALFCIALAGVLWGTSGIFSHYLRPYGFTAMQMATIRGLVAAVSMLIVVLIKDPKLLKLSKKEFPFILGSGISIYSTAAIYYAAIEASSVSTAVILMYTAPVFVLIYSVMFFGEKLNTIKSLSIFFMIVGCALVSGVVGGMKFSLLGVILGLGAGLAYSSYNIFTKILTIHKVHTLTVACYNFILMGIIGLLVSDPVGIVKSAAVAPAETIPLMLGIGIATCFLPYSLYTLGMKDIPAGTATALGIIEPLSATIFSVAFLGEPLTIPLIIGMILVLGSVFALAKQE